MHEDRQKEHQFIHFLIDWSADSKYLQSNCGAYELLFWKAETGEQHKHPHELRDVKWATFTCILGWPVQGIWPRYIFFSIFIRFLFDFYSLFIGAPMGRISTRYARVITKA